MSRRRHGALAALSLTAALGTAIWIGSSPGFAARSAPPPHYAAHGQHAVCATAPAHGVRCLSHVALNASGDPMQTSGPASGAYGPSDLQSAYGLAGAPSGAGETVAIVDAYNNPDAASDLAAYRSEYGLPPCTVASGCFRQLNEEGAASPLPRGNTSWGDEIDLDVEMVSAVCPSCSIALVEASSANTSDLLTAEDTAADLIGVSAVSNSWGGSEYSGETADNASFDHPGILITVAAGDDGYGVSFPASSQYVLSVGGTTLTPAPSSTRGWTETAWSGTGGGCSAYIPKPAWQTDTGCTMRTDNDVAAVADPNTGVAVYDSYGSGGDDWYVFGGTSVASPIVAGIGARAGATSPEAVYAAPAGALNDVVSGSDGSCSPAYLCTAGVGYDGPTGLGTPNGITAFGAGAGSPAPTPTASPTATPTPTPTATPTPPPTPKPTPTPRPHRHRYS